MGTTKKTEAFLEWLTNASRGRRYTYLQVAPAKSVFLVRIERNGEWDYYVWDNGAIKRHAFLKKAELEFKQAVEEE